MRVCARALAQLRVRARVFALRAHARARARRRFNTMPSLPPPRILAALRYRTLAVSLGFGGVGPSLGVNNIIFSKVDVHYSVPCYGGVYKKKSTTTPQTVIVDQNRGCSKVDVHYSAPLHLISCNKEIATSQNVIVERNRGCSKVDVRYSAPLYMISCTKKSCNNVAECNCQPKPWML